MLEKIGISMIIEFLKGINKKFGFIFGLFVFLSLANMYFLTKNNFDADDISSFFGVSKKDYLTYSEIHQNNPEIFISQFDEFMLQFPDIALVNLWLWRSDVKNSDGSLDLNARVVTSYYYDTKGNRMSWDKAFSIFQHDKKLHEKACEEGLYKVEDIIYISDLYDFTCSDFQLMKDQGVNNLKETKVVRNERHEANRGKSLVHDYWISETDNHNKGEARGIENGIYIPIRCHEQVGGYIGIAVIKSTKRFNGERTAIEFKAKKLSEKISHFTHFLKHGEEL